MIWAFWAAAGLAALAGLMPVIFAGPSSRLGGVLLPFWFGAITFAACALTHRQGRLTSSIIYFVAGLAIVFGLLALFSLPLRLAVLGTCPAPPIPCPSGLPRPLTDAENTAMGTSAVLGILAVFVGFLGLWAQYRQGAPPPTAPPPERRIPPLAPRQTEQPSDAPQPEPALRTQPEAPDAPTGPAEPDEPEELPPHVEPELPELPPPEPASGST